MDSEDDFSTVPLKCSALRIKGHVMMKNRPCKIVEMTTSRPGKHGHAKVHLVGLDIFTQRKIEDISPATHNVRVPNVARKDYSFLYITCNDTLALLDESTGEIRNDLSVPENEIGALIRQAEKDEKQVEVSVISACGEEAVVGVRACRQQQQSKD